MPKTRKQVTEKGCLDNYENPTKACKYITERLTLYTNKKEFVCSEGFPVQCNEKREMREIDARWKGDLANIKKYA